MDVRGGRGVRKRKRNSGSGSGSGNRSGSGNGSGGGSGGGGGAVTGIDLAGMDTAVKPGDDFFAYANGTWIKTNDIPADRSTWGADQILSEKVGQQNRDLIADAVATAGSGTEGRKVADYYAAFMDEAGIEAKGTKPLAPALAAIDNIADAKALATALGHSLRADVDVLNNTDTFTPNLLGLWIAQDLDDPSRYVPFLLQGGLDDARPRLLPRPVAAHGRDPREVPRARRRTC